MSAPSEPEKFSIDEMMERLKSQASEVPIDEGELVTRADGSQAIRLRKRKRRSQQPLKEAHRHSRRARMIQVSAALIFLLLVVIGAGSAIVFANSALFREKLLRNISRSSGAAVELEQFRMNPTRAIAGRLALRWPEGNALRELTLRNVKADVSLLSFLGKSLEGEEVSAAEGTLILRVPQADQPSRDAPASGATLPLQFKRYAIPKAHVLLGDPTAPFIRMRNSEGSFYPPNAEHRGQLLLSRGDITINGWPKLRMDRSHIEFRGTEVDVVSMRLRHETDNRGVLELTGTVSPYSSDRASTLAIHLEAYLLSGIVGPDLGRLFSGRIDTTADAKSNCLSFTPAADPAAALTIAFCNSLNLSFELNGFPFLFGLAQTMGDGWFERPVFESDVRGVILCADGNIAIGNLSCENKDRMALRGAVTMAPDRRLTGNLKVGVTDAAIQSSRTRRLDSLFGPATEGFRWLTLKIGGTAAAPTDNFKELFQSPQPAEKPDPSGEIPTFEELTQPK